MIDFLLQTTQLLAAPIIILKEGNYFHANQSFNNLFGSDAVPRAPGGWDVFLEGKSAGGKFFHLNASNGEIFFFGMSQKDVPSMEGEYQICEIILSEEKSARQGRFVINEKKDEICFDGRASFLLETGGMNATKFSNFLQSKSNPLVETIKEMVAGMREGTTGQHRTVNWGNKNFEINNTFAAAGFFSFEIVEISLAKTDNKIWEERILLKTLVDNLPVAVFAKDVYGKKILTNKKDVEFLGYDTVEEVLNKDDMEIFSHQSSEIPSFQKDMEILENGIASINYEETYVNRKGTQLYLNTSKIPLRDEAGKIFGMIGIARDVTDEVNDHRLLQLISFAFEHSGLAIFIVREDGTFLNVNNKACQSLGYGKEELLRLKIADISPKGLVTNEKWKAHWEELLEKRSFTIKSFHKRKDGTAFPVQINANLFQFGDTKINCGFITDITEKIKAEEALVKSIERYEYVLKATSEVIWEHDYENGLFFISDNFKAYFGHEKTGYQPEEGNIWAANVEPNDLEKIYKDTDNRIFNLKQDKISLEYRIKNAEGEFRWVADNYFVLRNESGKVTKLIGAFRDITNDKKMKEAIKISNKRYERALEATSEVVWEADLVNETLFLSSNFSHLFGYPSNGLMSITDNVWYMNIHPDDKEEVLLFAGNAIKLREYDKWENTYRFKKRDGSMAWIHDRASVVLDEKGKVISLVGSLKDITESKKMKDEITNLSLLQSSILDSSPMMIISTDKSGTINSINKCALESLGYLPEEIFGLKSPLHFHDFTEIEAESKQLSEEFETAVPPDFNMFAFKTNLGLHKEKEYTYYSKEHKKITVLLSVNELKDKNDQLIGYLFMGKDISDEKKIKNQLTQTNAILDQTLHELNQQKFALDQHAIVDITDIDGNITYVNDNFIRVSQFSREEVLGKNHRIFSSGRHDKNFFNNLHITIQKGFVWKGEICNHTKFGRELWLDTTIIPYLDSETKLPLRYISIRTEITSRKKAELERESLVKELLQHNHELRQYTYITTHNLRAPLTNLMAICRLLDNITFENPHTKKLIDGFKVSTRHLNDTLTDLINMLIIKEQRNLPMEEVDVNYFWNKVTDSLKYSIEGRKCVLTSDFSNCPTIQFYPAYMESILLNFLSNALKYSSSKRPPAIHVHTEKTFEGKRKLIFSDNGIGMDMKKVGNKIFGLYQRFHSNSDSKGIGLYLVHSQVTALGGEIECSSFVDVGTTFTITFNK